MMNTMYQEAGKANCATFCEGAMACMTAYLIHFCSETVRINSIHLLALITYNLENMYLTILSKSI